MKKITTALTAITLSLITAPLAWSNNISLEKVTADVTYLASDELKGRKSFSKEIDIAADYISERFEEIGLQPMQGLKNFKQTFNVTSITPESISVSINGNILADEHIGYVSTLTNINWNSLNDFKTHTVGAEQDIRKSISALNQQGGKHLVLVNNAHSEMFSRYRAYFSRGLNKLSLDHQGAIVIVLTDETALKQVAVEARSNISTLNLTNVVGVLPGKKQPNEKVLFSAHYDHLGVSNKEGDDIIYNGADDDASGTTAVINIAEYYTNKANNARSLVFAAFTAEEMGGFGSQYFSKQLDPDSVIAMINIEMIGKPSKFGAGKVWMTGFERSNLGKLLNESLKAKGTEIYQDPYPKQGLFYRSDNATLARLGVPAHSFSSTQLDKDQHYHKVSDDINSLDLNSMHLVIESLATSTEGLVSGEITPTRVDVNKVRSRGKIY